MDDTTKIICKGCKKKVAMSEMGHDDEDNLLCNSCLTHGKPINPKKEERALPEKPKNGEPYKCNNCGYDFFRVEGSKQSERCPYCSSTDIVPNDQSAQKLIDELSGFEEQKFFKE